MVGRLLEGQGGLGNPPSCPLPPGPIDLKMSLYGMSSSPVEKFPLLFDL